MGKVWFRYTQLRPATGQLSVLRISCVGCPARNYYTSGQHHQSHTVPYCVAGDQKTRQRLCTSQSAEAACASLCEGRLAGESGREPTRIPRREHDSGGICTEPNTTASAAEYDVRRPMPLPI